MEYTTKFNLGDHVWGVSSSDFQRIVKCKPCHNTGKVVIGDEELICPKCNGRSTHTQYAGQKFYLSAFDTEVGKITIEDVDSLYRQWDSNTERAYPRVMYMVSSTGVGSGRVWDEDSLFPSEKAAQAYCDLKNGVLPSDECEYGQAVIDNYGRVIV